MKHPKRAVIHDSGPLPRLRMSLARKTVLTRYRTRIPCPRPAPVRFERVLTLACGHQLKRVARYAVPAVATCKLCPVINNGAKS